VTKEAASEHSQTTAAAISSGQPMRPMGSWGDDPVPAFVGAFGEAVHHLGVDDAGADGVDPDVRPGVVEGGVLSQPDDAVFGGGVGGPAAEDLDPGAGGKSASLGRRYRRGVGRDAPAPDAKGKP